MGTEALPALIVCPNTMRRVWARELARWAPGLRVMLLSGSSAQRAKLLADVGAWDVAITNWESLRLLSRLAPYGSMSLSDKEKQDGPLNTIAWRTVIADEAHRAAGYPTRRHFTLRLAIAPAAEARTKPAE